MKKLVMNIYTCVLNFVIKCHLCTSAQKKRKSVVNLRFKNLFWEGWFCLLHIAEKLLFDHEICHVCIKFVNVYHIFQKKKMFYYFLEFFIWAEACAREPKHPSPYLAFFVFSSFLLPQRFWKRAHLHATRHHLW